MKNLVRDFGVKLAGLDVICKDISRPLDKSNGMISEINTTPGIHHHYLINEGTASVPVAELVLDHLFRQKQGVMRLNKGKKNSIPTGLQRPQCRQPKIAEG